MSDHKSFHRFIISAFAALGLLTAGPALAITVSPTGSWEADGYLTVHLFGTFLATCDTYVEGNVNAGGTGTITDLQFSGSSTCDSVGVNNLPYDAEFTDTDTLVIYDVDVDTSLGNCSGDLEGDWVNSSSEVEYDGAALNGQFGSTCRIFSITSPLDGTIDGLDTDPALHVQ